MNRKWLHITTFKVKKFVKKKMHKIILSGCIIGVTTGAVYWIRTEKNGDTEKYYNATLEIETEPMSNQKIYKIDYTDALYSDNVRNCMKEYLGGYEKYDFYAQNIDIDDEEDNKLFLNYKAYTEIEANKVLLKVSDEMEKEMQKKELIVELKKIRYTQEEIEIAKEERKIAVYYMMEIGTVCGMIITTIFLVLDFLLKDYISDSIDIYEYFNKPVLAVIPPAKEKSDKEK